MLFDRVVLAWMDQAGINDRLVALKASGYDIQILSSPKEVARRGRERGQSDFTPVLLTVSRPEARAAVAWLRDQLPHACLVVLVQTGCEGERLALLRMGVDWICRPDESADLLSEALLSLWRRHLGSVPLDKAHTHQGWTLCGQTWSLQGPCGKRIYLSTGERAVLSALFNAPGLTARYPELRAALDAVNGYPADLVRPYRELGIVVSRLRAKGRRVGLDIPVYAVYGQRYVFEPSESSPTSNEPEGDPVIPTTDESEILAADR